MDRTCGLWWVKEIGVVCLLIRSGLLLNMLCFEVIVGCTDANTVTNSNIDTNTDTNTTAKR